MSEAFAGGAIRSMLRIAVVAFMLCAASSAAFAADVLGIVTILEGNSALYRGPGRAVVAEGVRLAGGDIVDTAAGTFMQIELADGTVMQLGPATRVFFAPYFARQRGDRGGLYVLAGWVKLSTPKPNVASTAIAEIRTPVFDVAALSGTLVMNVAADGTAFVENGDSRLAERQAKGPATTVALKAGEFYARKPNARGGVAARPTQEFVGAMPRGFRDTLPLRSDRFRERDTPIKPASDFSYADVEAWLKSDPLVRRQLMQRWRAKAVEPAFRAGLVANLRAHPEWDPILYPDKYLPKEPPGDAAKTASPPPVSPSPRY